MFLKRLTQQTLSRYLKAFPVTGLTGPRQSGKTTLLRHELPTYRYVSFDDEFNVAAFEEDPKGFMRQYDRHVIFDEVQFVPKLFNYIKMSVDEHRSDYGRYVLTGSSQFSFLRQVSESLAGRIGLLTQLPLQFMEIPSLLQQCSIYAGSYPELVLRDYKESALWYSAYLETYLSKDIRTLGQIGNIRDFRRLIQLLAAQVSQPLDYTQYARNIGVTSPTIKHWISILEASYILFLVPPFYENYGKRITKSPRFYFYDTGLVSYLTGIQSYDLYDKGPLAGALFENYIVSEIQKNIKHKAIPAELYYFRTQDGAEIDLIVDYKTSKAFIEIKKNHSYTPRMSTALRSYGKEQDKLVVLYQGDSLQHGPVQVQNYQAYLNDIGKGVEG